MMGSKTVSGGLKGWDEHERRNGTSEMTRTANQNKARPSTTLHLLTADEQHLLCT